MFVNKTQQGATEISAYPVAALFQYFSKAFPENFISEAAGTVPVLFMFEQETM